MTRIVDRAVALEWLETNGLGDFACGTVAGPLTRRRHGLYTAGAAAQGRGMLLVASLEVTIERDGESHPLSCHQYAGGRYPDGYSRCAGFRLAPFPEWRYEVPGAALTAQVCMCRGKAAVAVLWTLDPDSSPSGWRLRVRPLFAYRESGALTRANGAARLAWREEGGALFIAPYEGCPEMALRAEGAAVRPAPDWFLRFHHPWDAAYGEESEEDFFSVFELTYPLAPGATATLTAGTDRDFRDPVPAARAERRRRLALTLSGMGGDVVADALARAADALTTTTDAPDGGLIAGLPERRDDLRMKLIALPGLLLCTRRLEEAKSFLARRLRETVASAQAPLNDTPLWLARAAELYVDHSRDWDFLRDGLTPAAEIIVRRYAENRTDAGFHLASDGLLASECPGEALTWMDARVDGWPLTPRAGKPVEVNALWHHLLSSLSRWVRRGNGSSSAEVYERWRDLAARSFRLRFWNETEGCLRDVADPPAGCNGPAGWLRPNQIIALALPGDLLDRRQARQALETVERRLLTPAGLRTLPEDAPPFQPRYGGGPVERASARHQGTVHPWLIGAYVDAVFRVQGRTSRGNARAAAAVDSLLATYRQQGRAGHVAEMADGAPPHAAQGNFACAASLGEVIRAYVEVRGRAW